MLNLKALIIVGVCLVVSRLIASHFHSKNVVATTAYLRSTGYAALEEGDTRRAFDLLQQYQMLTGGDRETQDTISRLLADQHDSRDAQQQAFDINENTLLAEKDNHVLRLRQAELAVQLNRLSDADAHLDRLRNVLAENSRVWHLSGVVANELDDTQTAIRHLQRAVWLDDCDEESFDYLIRVLETLEEPDTERIQQLADELVDRFHTAESLRIRARWLISQEQTDEAITDLWNAVDKAPNSIRTSRLLVLATQKRIRRQSEEDSSSDTNRLIAHLQTQLNDYPHSTTLRLWLGSLYWESGDRSQAITILQRAMVDASNDHQLRATLFDYLVDTQQIAEATSLRKSLPYRTAHRGLDAYMHARLLMHEESCERAVEAFDSVFGLAADDALLVARARMHQAACRAKTGDTMAARDTYRTVVQKHPQADAGRLGIASSYVDADELPLAIAEYRQLLHVPNVPAFLTNLIIEHNLTLPIVTRDWAEAEELIRDTEPFIPDKVQRILLQADIRFAQGRPATALLLLEEAKSKLNHRPEIRQALHRITVTDANSLQQTLLSTLAHDPESFEAHLAQLRLLIAQSDPSQAERWLNQVAEGQIAQQLQPNNRRQLILQVTDALLRLFPQSISQKHHDMIVNTMTQTHQSLVADSVNNWPAYTAFLIRTHDHREAWETVLNHSAELPADIEAECWVQCLRSPSIRKRSYDKVLNRLVELISLQPASFSLRISYADALVLMDQLEDARTVLQQLVDFNPTSTDAVVRLAAVMSYIGSNHEAADQLSAQALQLAGSNIQVRTTRALTLLNSDSPESSLHVLNAIPIHRRSTESRILEAMALIRTGRKSEAGRLVHLIEEAQDVDLLSPAELRQLDQIRDQLQNGLSEQRT